MPRINVADLPPPAGFGDLDARWLRITPRGRTTQVAAVFKPSSRGPHPVVVLFHGSSGLARLQLGWASKLATQGFTVVAGCYLDAAAGTDPSQFLGCPGLPTGSNAIQPPVMQSAQTLIDYASMLAVDRTVAVVGMSLGANIALDLDAPHVTAIVADSGYRDTPGTTRGSILVLGFTGDPKVPQSKFVAFEATQAEKNPVESHYYAGASHVTLLTPATTGDANARLVTFLRHTVG